MYVGPAGREPRGSATLNRAGAKSTESRCADSPCRRARWYLSKCA